jgi:DNA processing protein
MKISRRTLEILAAQELNIIKSNNDFWINFYNNEVLFSDLNKDQVFLKKLDYLYDELKSNNLIDGVISIYDQDFPKINKNIKNTSEKPYLIIYKGNIVLLEASLNVAVVGLTNPDSYIVEEETKIIKRLIDNKMNIVSGLARGCDTVAHSKTIDYGGKTIAILPSTINNIYPKENKELVNKIIKNGGLIITEYYKEPKDRYKFIKRFIERDRLQAIFSKVVILVASYKKNEGDSGSRHALEFSTKYGSKKLIFNPEQKHKSNPMFGLNIELLTKDNSIELTDDKIQELSILESSIDKFEQLKLL